MRQQDVWDGEAARRHDTLGTGMFVSEVLGPAVDRLVGLAGNGEALQFAIDTGRVTVPLAQRGVPGHGVPGDPCPAHKRTPGRCERLSRPLDEGFDGCPCGRVRQTRAIASCQLHAAVSSPQPLKALQRSGPALDRRTRVLAISAAQYSSSHRYDLGALGQACQDSDVLLVVDGTQAVGAVTVDAGLLGVDVLAVSAHKWMLGPGRLPGARSINASTT
jgi:hypothetical protein